MGVSIEVELRDEPWGDRHTHRDRSPG
ncbi:hypothetical protein ACQ4N7_13465 [Nodosilinea sp. AN01ver1]